jgi:hypothetical protein
MILADVGGAYIRGLATQKVTAILPLVATIAIAAATALYSAAALRTPEPDESAFMP